MDGKVQKHKCPGCGFPIIAEVVGSGDTEHLEITYDGNGDGTDYTATVEAGIQQRIDAAVAERIAAAREQWNAEHEQRKVEAAKQSAVIPGIF